MMKAVGGSNQAENMKKCCVWQRSGSVLLSTRDKEVERWR